MVIATLIATEKATAMAKAVGMAYQDYVRLLISISKIIKFELWVKLNCIRS